MCQWWILDDRKIIINQRQCKTKYDKQSYFDRMELDEMAQAISGIIYSSLFQRIIFQLLGTILLVQAISNTGCCGSGGCGVNQTKITDENEEPKFEIIKPK